MKKATKTIKALLRASQDEIVLKSNDQTIPSLLSPQHNYAKSTAFNSHYNITINDSIDKTQATIARNKSASTFKNAKKSEKSGRPKSMEN